MLSFNIGQTIDFRDNQCPFSRERSENNGSNKHFMIWYFGSYPVNAFQPMIRNILEGKQLTDYHQKIKIVEKITKTKCVWPLHHCYDMVPQPVFISIGI